VWLWCILFYDGCRSIPGIRLTRASLKVAVGISRHGYGHLIRTAEVLECLAKKRPLELLVHATVPPALWPRALTPFTTWIDQPWDAGAVQVDDLNVNREATAARLDQWETCAPQVLDAAVQRLRQGYDLVIGDVPPLAFEAAHAVGLPSFAIANFSWDWIYQQMGFGAHAARAAGSYAKADLLFALAPCAPMDAFVARRDVGVLGRRSERLRHHVRQQLGVRLEQRLVLPAFREAGAGLLCLPETGLDIVWLLASQRTDLAGRSDWILAPPEVPWIDLVAAADAVVSKPGYGILGDTAGTGTPLLYAPRRGFPEDPVLEAALASRKVVGEVPPEHLLDERWIDELSRILALERPLPDPIPAAEAIATEIDERFT
jgi:hypothetical protein